MLGLLLPAKPLSPEAAAEIERIARRAGASADDLSATSCSAVKLVGRLPDEAARRLRQIPALAFDSMALYVLVEALMHAYPGWQPWVVCPDCDMRMSFFESEIHDPPAGHRCPSGSSPSPN